MLSALAAALGSLLREGAAGALIEMRLIAEPTVGALLGATDIEVRSRAREIRGTWFEFLRPYDRGPLPWIDQLPKMFPDRMAIMERWRSVTGTGEREQWHGCRAATALYLRTRLEAGDAAAGVAAEPLCKVRPWTRTISSIRTRPTRRAAAPPPPSTCVPPAGGVYCSVWPSGWRCSGQWR